jgi:hypothetical protein
MTKKSKVLSLRGKDSCPAVKYEPDTPGILKRSIDKYLRIPAVNWSTLKEMQRSALHYAHRKENPREDSSGLARGRAVHTAVLEPELFSKEYVVYEGKTRQGNAWKAFKEAYSDKTILKTDEYDKAWRCATRILKHPEAKAIMRDCAYEKTFTWTDPKTGLKCKCRVDGIGSVLFDLKTTSDCDARMFGRIAARLLYHGQLAMYGDGAKHTGETFIVAAEAEPPFDVAVFQLGEDEIAIGQELYQGLLQQVAGCEKSGDWPGRYPMRERLVLPRYVYGTDDEEGGTYEVLQEQSA